MNPPVRLLSDLGALVLFDLVHLAQDVRHLVFLLDELQLVALGFLLGAGVLLLRLAEVLLQALQFQLLRADGPLWGRGRAAEEPGAVGPRAGEEAVGPGVTPARAGEEVAPPGGTSAVTPSGSASGSALRCYSASVTWTVARRRCTVAMALGSEKDASTGSLTACWWET